MLLAVLLCGPTAEVGADGVAPPAGATHRGETSASILIQPGAASHGYSTPQVTISPGGQLSVVNLDDMEHTVTSVDVDPTGKPLFSVFAEPHQTTPIKAASGLAPGSYQFYCQFHPTMRGVLTVSGNAGPPPPGVSFDLPLRIPPVITSAHVVLRAHRALVRALPHGPRTWMWTYGGSYPGPTIVRPDGQDTKVTLINDLPRGAGPLTMHFHGDHHAWTEDGQPTRFLVRHGRSRTYDFPLTEGGKPERAAFDFYHDHAMGHTTRNVWMGLQGMVITHDELTPGLRLPTGRRDVPLLFADREFTSTNQLIKPKVHRMPMDGPMAPPNDTATGSRVLVNGEFAPYFRVSATRYRLRLLNGSAFSSYDFQLSDGRPFVQIGTGPGLLPKPVVRTDLLLGPAQRADVIVDFHGEVGQSVILRSVPSDPAGPGALGTRQADLMQFRVTRTARDRSRIPTRMLKPPAMQVPAHVTARWFLGLKKTAMGSTWTINGKMFDPRRVEHAARLGSTGRWLIRNDSPMTHFVHLHEELWRTILRDGKRPPPWERGLEDTWRLDPGESVVVAARFTDYTGVFMVHCHMLTHEDDGLMSQFAVVSRRHPSLPAGYFLRRR